MSEKGKHPTSNIQHPTPNDTAGQSDDNSGADWLIREGKEGGRKYDLEERLLEFASASLTCPRSLPCSRRASCRWPDLSFRHVSLPKPRRKAGDAESPGRFHYKPQGMPQGTARNAPMARLTSRIKLGEG